MTAPGPNGARVRIVLSPRRGLAATQRLFQRPPPGRALFLRRCPETRPTVRRFLASGAIASRDGCVNERSGGLQACVSENSPAGRPVSPPDNGVRLTSGTTHERRQERFRRAFPADSVSRELERSTCATTHSEMYASRPAREQERLRHHAFPSGSVGLASPGDTRLRNLRSVRRGWCSRTFPSMSKGAVRHRRSRGSDLHAHRDRPIATPSVSLTDASCPCSIWVPASA